MRGNPEETVKSNEEMFFEYYNSNVKESKSILHYEFKKDEYLEDIIQKFGIKLSPNTQNKEKWQIGGPNWLLKQEKFSYKVML